MSVNLCFCRVTLLHGVGSKLAPMHTSVYMLLAPSDVCSKETAKQQQQQQEFLKGACSRLCDSKAGGQQHPLPHQVPLCGSFPSMMCRWMGLLLPFIFSDYIFNIPLASASHPPERQHNSTTIPLLPHQPCPPLPIEHPRPPLPSAPAPPSATLGYSATPSGLDSFWTLPRFRAQRARRSLCS